MTEPWPEADLERVEVCPVCRSAERETFLTGLTDRVHGIAAGSWTLIRCGRCRSAYLDPRPTRETVGRAYAGADYVTHRLPRIEAPAVGSLARARRSVRNGYVNRRWGYDLRPASPLGRLVGAVLPLRAQTDRIFRQLVLPAPGAPLLDVGCGNGEAVLQFAARGWDATGHEIDPAAAEHARRAGASVISQPLDELARDSPGHYAAITLSHVIEHEHDPPALLRTLRRLLRPGGTLWLATPNLDSRGSAQFANNWMALEPPRHLVLFTRESLHRALEEAGFSGVRFPTPWGGDGGLLDSSRDLRENQRPDVYAAGSHLPDLRNLLQPRGAEELVALGDNRPSA